MHKLPGLLSQLCLIFFLCVINTVAQEQPRPLTLNSPIERELSGGQTHVYAIKLNANQIARVITEQKGVDVVVSIIAPDGATLFEVDSPNGSVGEEPATIAAKQGGLYRIEIRSLEKNAATGRYTIRLDKFLTEKEYATERLAALGRLMTYKFRVARPTDNLKEVLEFYRDGLGLEVLTSFNHLGYEGQILGRKDSPYHLEFLHQRGRKFGKASTQNNLLVFYMPEAEWKIAVERMQKHGYQPVKSYNPYWEEKGKTFEDIDGYRVVLQQHSKQHFRVTRSTDNLKEVFKFYRDGLGLDVLFWGKDGKWDGGALGRKGAPYEFEFENVEGETVGKAPTHENLLVFFIPDEAEWKSAVERMQKHGYQPVKAENPWGNTKAKTFEDIDGYRIVLKNTNWN